MHAEQLRLLFFILTKLFYLFHLQLPHSWKSGLSFYCPILLITPYPGSVYRMLQSIILSASSLTSNINNMHGCQ